MTSNGNASAEHDIAHFDAAHVLSVPMPIVVAGSDGLDSVDAPDPRDWLAAIIDGSGDAIISKDLHGIIQSWNPGATRLFGYAPEEVIGKSITILIPEDRLNEEPRILAEIQRGRRVLPFETRRLRKNGELVDISLTISPIHNAHGNIVGASKVARDITERRMAQEQQRLLMGEMRHRVKNLFALANAIVTISSRSAGSLEQVVETIQDRLQALARAHELTMSDAGDATEPTPQTDLQALIEAILAPYSADNRIVVEGPELLLGGRAVTHVALLLHELATNAAKYGSLSVFEGRLAVRIESDGVDVRLRWEETGGPRPVSDGGAAARDSEGFGTRLEKGIAATLKASIDREWRPSGLIVSIVVPRAAIEL
ncbi:PAS domain S-box protein [Sphingopyxis sp. JAI108]|uniref:PAS domain S-box protein n=1 Tax=Sphingopyxis sp. JAI108 TaxID=2723060 RepID=UPI001797473C|nr:PAS domain S-box protein [Sphingopyxis sp. JAI108]NYF32626.1 PAS domain S-box-containing protein [Sphingopyxis sp. JAI108]